MANEIKAGDPVQLNSGGPRMTIDWIETAGLDVPKAHCSWFDDKMKQQHGSFPITSLTKI